MLQLAECGASFGQIDIFKVRAYEDHFNLPKGRIAIITNYRVMLLQHPTQTSVQRKLDKLKDPCTVLWDVTWADFSKVEPRHGKKEKEKETQEKTSLAPSVAPQNMPAVVNINSIPVVDVQTVNGDVVIRVTCPRECHPVARAMLSLQEEEVQLDATGNNTLCTSSLLFPSCPLYGC